MTMETMTTISTPSTSTPHPGPLERFHLGNIHVTVWENTDPKGETYLKVQIERRYQDKNGDWQSINSFRTNEIPVVQELTRQAYDYVHARLEAA